MYSSAFFDDLLLSFLRLFHAGGAQGEFDLTSCIVYALFSLRCPWPLLQYWLTFVYSILLLLRSRVLGALFGSGNVTPYYIGRNPASGAYSSEAGPGACGPNDWGIGNLGLQSYNPADGIFSGGMTPFGERRHDAYAWPWGKECIRNLVRWQVFKRRSSFEIVCVLGCCSCSDLIGYGSGGTLTRDSTNCYVDFSTIGVCVSSVQEFNRAERFKGNHTNCCSGKQFDISINNPRFVASALFFFLLRPADGRDGVS